MDNGAQKRVARLDAFQRYCQHARVSPKVIQSSDRFGMGRHAHNSLGVVEIRFPIEQQGKFLSYETNVGDVPIPILFGLEKMKELE